MRGKAYMKTQVTNGSIRRQSRPVRRMRKQVRGESGEEVGEGVERDGG